MAKVDMDSPEFKKELEKTKDFTAKVLKQFNLVYHPNLDIVEGIWLGLTRNKLMYGKRYCPCFFVTQTPEDRLCPCKPALEHEIKDDGRCHCQIYCTQEYAKSVEDPVANANSDIEVLTSEQCGVLLAKKEVDGASLQKLLAARASGVCKFVLVDVREQMEHDRAHIKGTDYLIPSSTCQSDVQKLMKHKDENVIVYCQAGARSAYCCDFKRDIGFKNVTNLSGGIIDYKGEIERA